MKKLVLILMALVGLIIPLACSNQNPTGPLATYNLTATFTSTATYTPTNWAGYTSTPTPGAGTYTATVTATLTSTPTVTPTNTYVYSPTPTTTPTPTSTYLPTPAPTSTPWSTGSNPPNGVAFDGSTTIYVAEGVEEETGGLIQMFNTSGTALGTMTTYDGTNSFGQPDGVVYANGNIYVVDQLNNAVYEIDPQNNSLVNSLTSFSTLGAGTPTSFLNPEGIAVDSLGNIYIADTGNDYVEEFNSSLSSTPLNEVGGLGDGNGQFNNPSAIAINGSGIYVADASNQRIQIFASGLSYSSQFSIGSNSDVYGITLDGSNNVYLADSGTGQVEEYSSTGTLLTSGLGGAMSNASPDGLVFIGSNLLVADYSNDQLYLVTP